MASLPRPAMNEQDDPIIQRAMAAMGQSDQPDDQPMPGQQSAQDPMQPHDLPSDPSTVTQELGGADLGQSINDPMAPGNHPSQLDPLSGAVQGQPGTVVATIPDQTPAPLDPQTIAQLRAAGAALYGTDFPLLKQSAPDEDDWVQWAIGLWDRHRAGMQKVLHTVERNRLFRAGSQWVTAVGLAPWREPPKPRDVTRAVENVIKPALDLRVQIVREQIPGFRTRPTSEDIDAEKKAEAQQKTLEYCYAEQQMADVLAEAEYWAGTDGVSFLHCYWDPDNGPWAEYDGRHTPLGDTRTCVLRIEQVRVSANATATRKPNYWIIRETMPTAEAVAIYGPKVVDKATMSQLTAGGGGPDIAATLAMDRLALGTPGVNELFREQDTVDRFTVHCDRSEFLPHGLTLVAVGNALVVQPQPLPYGVVPLVRITDGSTDPAFYPTPIMSDWVSHQMRINATKSKWIDSVRRNSDRQFVTRKGTMVTETLVGGSATVWEVNGPMTDPSQALVPVQGFSIGSDVKDLLEAERLLFEQKSGWNDTTRGSFTSDQSGRAILAVREQVERVFAPVVQAAATGMSQWGEIELAIYREMLKMPRAIGIVGSSRSDLARQITAEDFDGVSKVEIDPETLMPMPRSLKLYLLDQLYEKQVISASEYRQRLPFAFTDSIDTPDDRKEARAQRIADAIIQSLPVPPMRWTDNEAIVQDVLEREILDRDDVDPQVIAMAQQVWTQYANQSAQKQGGAPMGGAPGGQGFPPPQGQPLPGNQQPTFGSNPSIAAAPLSMQHPSDQQQAATGYDAMNKAAA